MRASNARPQRVPAALLGLVLVAAAGPAALAQAPAPSAPPVGVAKVARIPVVESSEFVGRVQAVNRVDLVARVTAFLMKRNFVEGGEVKAGDVLYQLERPPFEAQVAAQAAAVAQAEAVQVNNRLTLNRAQSLLHTPAGQQSTVDAAQASAKSGAAQIAQAQAQLRIAQINLDYTEIKAPIDGRISRTAVTEGNVVSPSTGTLATIVSQDPMYVVFPVSVRAALDLRDRYADKGAGAVTIKLRLPGGRTYEQNGKLDYVDPTVAQNTDTLIFRGTMPNPVRPGAQSADLGSRELFDGEFVTVLLQGVEPVQALAVPRVAVLSDQQGNYVWVVGEGDKVEQRRVQLGQSTPETAVISSGLKEGETVIVDGVQRARPGIVVKPQPLNAQPSVPAQGPRI